MREIYTQEEVSKMARTLLDMGIHPSVVRRRLSERGIHWQYQFSSQGKRERLRRLRQQGLGLCSTCFERPYKLGSPVNVCRECLERKFDPHAHVA